MYRRAGPDREFQTLFCVTLLSYAAMIQYIGRSHDANVLSLFPYHALILIYLVLNASALFIRVWTASTLALWISWVLVAQFAPSPNRYDNIFTFDGGDLDSVIVNYFENPTNSDRGRAIDYITRTYGEGVTVFDPMANIVATEPQAQWTTYNNFTTFYSCRAIRKSSRCIEQSST